MFRPAVLLTVLILCLLTVPAAATDFGAQLVWGDDTDIGIGGLAEISTPQILPDTSLQFGVNWFFPDSPAGVDLTFWEINGNWLYPLNLGVDTAASFYVGGGLNIAHASVDVSTLGSASNTDLGINLLGGTEIPIGEVNGFAELRITLSGSEQFTIGAGVKF